MSWNQTVDADGYTAFVAAVSSGDQLYCNSTSPSCSLSSLKCGESYALMVRSYNRTCFSMRSQQLTIQEGIVIREYTFGLYIQYCAKVFYANCLNPL